MRCFAMLGIGEVGWIEKDIPACGPLDAVCRPLAVAVCAGDIHTAFEGAAGECVNLVLGRECAAEIVEVGSLVKDFKAGDRVLVPAVTSDRNGNTAQSSFAAHSGEMPAGRKVPNIKDGVFSEYFHVGDADGNLAQLPRNISLADACMLSDTVPAGFHGAELADIAFGDDVLVIGIGPVGLMAVAGSALRGAARIIAVGTREKCVEAAKKYGANDFVSYKNGGVEEQVLRLTKGEGVDKAIIAGGNANSFAEAVRCVKPGGKIGSVNYLGGGEIVIPAGAWSAGIGHKQISGGIMPGGRLRTEKLARLISRGRLDVSPLSTHVFNGWEHLPEALSLMKSKPADLIKAVVRLV